MIQYLLHTNDVARERLMRNGTDFSGTDLMTVLNSNSFNKSGNKVEFVFVQNGTDHVIAKPGPILYLTGQH